MNIEDHESEGTGVKNTGTSSSKGGIGFTGLLTIAFIVLKLVGVIDWPWLWVLSPIWISILIVIVVVLGFFFISRR